MDVKVREEGNLIIRGEKGGREGEAFVAHEVAGCGPTPQLWRRKNLKLIKNEIFVKKQKAARERRDVWGEEGGNVENNLLSLIKIN